LISEGQLTIRATPKTAGQMDFFLCVVNTVGVQCVLLGIVFAAMQNKLRKLV